MIASQTPTEQQVREVAGEVGDALQRAVVLSADRLQSVVDDAVVRGRMTRRDAEELVTNLIALGREQAQELRGDVARLLTSVDPRKPKA